MIWDLRCEALQRERERDHLKKKKARHPSILINRWEMGWGLEKEREMAGVAIYCYLLLKWNMSPDTYVHV